jgi:predicted  nucleic acid-binding Zn-ribbon protein
VSKRLLTLVVLAALAVACGPSPEDIRRQRVLSEMKDIDVERDPLVRAVAERQARITSLETELQKRELALQQFRSQVEAYMMNHKMAVAAIAAGVGGTSVALSDDNAFSSDAKAVAGVVGFIAALWAIENASEVGEVLDQMVQADARVKSFESQMRQIRGAIEQEQARIVSDRTRLSTLSAQLVDLRAKL